MADKITNILNPEGFYSNSNFLTRVIKEANEAGCDLCDGVDTQTIENAIMSVELVDRARYELARGNTSVALDLLNEALREPDNDIVARYYNWKKGEGKRRADAVAQAELTKKLGSRDFVLSALCEGASL